MGYIGMCAEKGMVFNQFTLPSFKIVVAKNSPGR